MFNFVSHKEIYIYINHDISSSPIMECKNYLNDDPLDEDWVHSNYKADNSLAIMVYEGIEIVEEASKSKP